MPQCKATAHRTGQQCRRLAMKGQAVCPMHGGASRHARKAAKRRLAIEAAQRMVERSGQDLDPLEHLLDCLYLAATEVRVFGLMVADLDDVAAREALERGGLRGELGYERNGKGLSVRSRERLLALDRQGVAQVHPFIVEYNQALERRARFAKLCLDADVGERRMELAERMAQGLAGVFERALAVVEGLSEVQRLEAARAFAREVAVLERPAVDRVA